jgi:hypothetical protein
MKRRDFIKSSALLGGGLMISFHATALQTLTDDAILEHGNALGDFCQDHAERRCVLSVCEA